MRQVILSIRGLIGSGCAGEVRRTLEQTDGVCGVAVDVPSRCACVALDELACDTPALIAAVTRAGYQVDGFGRL